MWTEEQAPYGLTSRRENQTISLSHIVVGRVLQLSSTAFLPARSSSLGLLANWEALLRAGAGWRECALGVF